MQCESVDITGISLKEELNCAVPLNTSCHHLNTLRSLKDKLNSHKKIKRNKTANRMAVLTLTLGQLCSTIMPTLYCIFSWHKTNIEINQQQVLTNLMKCCTYISRANLLIRDCNETCRSYVIAYNDIPFHYSWRF